MIELNELFFGVWPFTHVAETRSFRQAAERLGVSTAAVSKAVRKLEERLGVRLFTRSSRSVVLTPEGERYFQHCREAIASMEVARELMSQSRRSPSGELRISMSFILGRRVVPALSRFAARYPKVALRVSLSDRVSNLQEEDHLDVALLVGVRDDSNLIQKRLLKTRWVTVVSPAFLLRHGLPKEPADLARLNCLRFLLPNGKPRDFSFLDPASGRGETRAVTGNLLIDHGDQLLDAARAGMGVAQVLDFMAADGVRQGDLTEILSAFCAQGPPVCAVSAPERSKTPNVRAFIGFLTELFDARFSNEHMRTL
jgi:DNA-binding transcriptional LysR family regulator